MSFVIYNFLNLFFGYTYNNCFNGFLNLSPKMHYLNYSCIKNSTNNSHVVQISNSTKY